MNQKMKQILAISCVVLLVSLYIATFVFAIANFPGSDKLFQASLFATIGLPVLLWIYLWIYKKLAKDRAAAQGDSVTGNAEEIEATVESGEADDNN